MKNRGGEGDINTTMQLKQSESLVRNWSRWSTKVLTPESLEMPF